MSKGKLLNEKLPPVDDQFVPRVLASLNEGEAVVKRFRVGGDLHPVKANIHYGTLVVLDFTAEGKAVLLTLQPEVMDLVVNALVIDAFDDFYEKDVITDKQLMENHGEFLTHYVVGRSTEFTISEMKLGEAAQ